MTSCGLAIFVKTPALSAVKTRLWPRIGRRRAEEFHLASAAAVASVALEARTEASAAIYWAVAEAPALHGDAWSDLRKLAQGEGGLGTRMHRVYRQMRRRHRAAILIGADAPQVTSHHLVRAARWLDGAEPRLAMGRAHDGGFWLFGGNVDLPEPAWADVVYSRPDTAECFVRVMHPYGRLLEVGALDDVDEYDDIARVLTSLECLTQPTPAQRRLASWMSDLARDEGVPA